MKKQTPRLKNQTPRPIVRTSRGIAAKRRTLVTFLPIMQSFCNTYCLYNKAAGLAVVAPNC